jgi:hypothetical protein
VAFRPHLAMSLAFPVGQIFSSMPGPRQVFIYLNVIFFLRDFRLSPVRVESGVTRSPLLVSQPAILNFCAKSCEGETIDLCYISAVQMHITDILYSYHISTSRPTRALIISLKAGFNLIAKRWFMGFNSVDYPWLPPLSPFQAIS